MARTTTFLGIELAGDELRLAVVERSEQGLALQKAQVVTSGEELARFVRALPRRPSAVTCAVPLETAAIRILNLPPTTEDNMERVVSLEAEAALPLSSEQLALAHHVLGMTDQSRMEVLLAAARQDTVQAALSRVNFAPWVSASVTLSSVALLNALHEARGAARENVCAVLKVEEGASELTVYDHQRIVAAQTIPVGCGVRGAVPEERPVAVGAGAGPGGGDRDGLPAPTMGWVAALSQQVRYTLQALSYERGVSVERLYLCGRGASQSGADWQLGEHLETPVAVLAPGGGIEPGQAVFAAAFGSAVQAAGAAPVSLNLTPMRVTAAREVEQRRQTRLSWTALATASGVALGLVFGAAVYNQKRALADVNARLREVQSIRVEKPPLPPAELKEAVQALEAASESRVPPSKMLSALSRQLPAGTWLAELSYNAETGCVVRGFSTDQSGAQKAHIALLRQQLFDEVTLDYRTEEMIGTVPVWGFQLTCKLTPREPAGYSRGAGRTTGGTRR